MIRGGLVSLVEKVRQAPHRDCGALPYHELFKLYLASVREVAGRRTGDGTEQHVWRSQLQAVIDDCLLSSVVATKWTDVLADPEQLTPSTGGSSPPSTDVFSPLFPTMFSQASEIRVPRTKSVSATSQIVTANFMSSVGGIAHLSTAFGGYKIAAASIPVGAPAAFERRVAFVPFSVLHHLRRETFHSTSIPKAGTAGGGQRPTPQSVSRSMSAIGTVEMLMRMQHEVEVVRRLVPHHFLVSIIPPSTEFELILNSKRTKGSAEGKRDGSAVLPLSQVLTATDVRTALLALELRGCSVVDDGGDAGGRKGGDARRDRRTYEALGLRCGKWDLANPMGDTTTHRSVIDECSKLANKFDSREKTLRQMK